MSKITRYTGNLKAFASEATGTERTIFGDTAQSDSLDANITLELLRGWGVIGVESNPTKQHFNGLGFTLGQLIAYLHQQGVPEWNAAQEYYAGSVVTTLAGIYRLKSGGDGSYDPDTEGGVNWELIPTQTKVDAKADQATTYTETEVDGLLNAKAAISGQAFSGDISAPNLSGTNSGDQDLSAKADQATTYTETEVNNLLDDKAAISGQTFSGNISAPNLRGTNTGDQDLSAKADQATTYTETEVDDLLDDKAAISGQAFSGDISAPNLSGTNTGDQDLSAKADQDTTYTKTEVDGLFVNLTGDQDVDGVKTFTISPIVPTPTVGTQSANKQYVDGLVDPVPPITGTATFTNTTNNIALPGIGSIGLEVGDVVQVTGTASNSKLFSVEVITDSGNVIVNQAHAGGTTTKSLVNETVSATVTLLAKWYNAAAGLGQGWVKPARSASVLYTNNTGRLVFVIVSFNAAVSGDDRVEVDGVRITESTATNGEDIPQSFTVPSGSTYEAFSSNFLNGWAELR